MKPELSLLAAFLSHSMWETHGGDIQASQMPDDLQPIFRVLEGWHKTQAQDLQVLDLASLFFAQHKGNKEFYEGVFDTLKEYVVNEEVVSQLVKSIKRTKILRDLSITSYEAVEGKKPFSEVEKLVAQLEDKEEEKEEDIVSDELGFLLDTTYRTPGLRWRLDALNKSLGSLRKGDFGFIFARPETGKTTFFASEATHMADQMDSCVLWINNEEVHEKVFTRIYQAAFGVTLEQLMSNTQYWSEQFRKKYNGRIVMPKQSSFSRWDVERLAKKYKPGLIIIDQLTKITGFEADRDDLVLGAKFQWGRELAKQWCPVIGVSQADGTAENQKWLTMQHVANAKTAVQAEADWIVGIGTIHDSGWEDIRFIHPSKNKLSGDPDSDPALRHGKMQVKIRPDIARYEDL